MTTDADIITSMKLLLTSSGITNKSIEKALRILLGKPYKDACLTFIPTAANVEHGDKSWLVEDMNNFRVLGLKSFDIMDISAVSEDIWLPSLKNADILVFGGGNADYLLTWIQNSGLCKHLPKLMESKIYVGISAGSMIAAHSISLSSADILYYEKTGTHKDRKGLGFVDFEIRPHLNSEWFPNVRIDYLEKFAKDSPKTFYAIDDNTAIEVVDGTIRIISEGIWKKFH